VSRPERDGNGQINKKRVEWLQRVFYFGQLKKNISGGNRKEIMKKSRLIIKRIWLKY
tara:strand:+ start:1352 stop:1522 length:171 start_codon:yes stop_codon:yes gene_type:complete